jgi:hypothetical protein
MKEFSARSRARLRKAVCLSSLACLFAAALAVFTSTANAQQLTGTLSGTAYDQSGAVVPKAQVVLKNQASGDERATVTANDGHFVITAVQPGSYSILISATGFSSWQENDITMNVGDNRDVPNIKLQVGGNSTQVSVVAGADAVVPTDTAEISTSLNQQMINDFPLAGRDAGELLKIMPGMALNNGASQGSGFNDRIVGSNNGPVGAYSSNGTQPYGTMAYMLDGANLVDPGNDGTQIANINPDMVGNIKVLISNYGAEYAKGPVIFQAFSRSGGSQFHGEGYFYTHNQALNSVDAYTKSQGPTAVAEATAAASYYYMGGNIGGPIVFPHFIHYNQNRNKLFFWGGYEYMKQQPAGTALNFNVPNSCQLGGDFSNGTCTVNPNAVTTWPNFYSTLNNNLPTGGTATSIPTSSFDPNMQGILKLYPGANETPSSGNGYNNYSYVNTSPQNRWEATGKVDFALSDNDKITGSYTYQKESDLAPISIWWSAPWTLPYPTPAASKTTTYVILTNYTHVFSPTTTNEFVFTWSHFQNPYALANPAKVSRATNNFNVQGLFGHTTSQIPAFEGPWGGTLANLGSSYPFSSGSFGGLKQVPAFYDNFTKIVGNHTLKAGFYWDSSQNTQNNTFPDMGIYNYGGNQFSTNNYVADVELGHVANYQQQNSSPVQAIKWHQWSIYGQDSWKAAKSLTVNIGLRFDHIGNWYGTDFQVWDPGTYVNSTSAPNNTGLAWHANNPSIPVSGMPSNLFHIAPRLGLAYDIFGNGRTVFRGGFGIYYYQASTEVANAANGPLGSFLYTTPTAFEGVASIANFTPPSSVAQNGSSVDAMQRGDSRVPFTNNWNATISQALPWRSVVEVSYVGNRSANEWEDGTNSNIYNLNNVSRGGFFQPDPVTHQYVSPASPGCSTTSPANQSLYCQNNPGAYTPNFTVNDFRPLVAYQNVYLLTHLPYSNYNGFQAQWQKQSGPITFIANYTFGKVLGIRDGGSNNGNGNGTGIDPFNIRANYGPLAYDHTHILNFTYNWALPSPIHGQTLSTKLAAGAVNGWKISGYTAFQSGQPLQPNEAGALNVTYASGLTVPTVAHPDLPDNSIKLPSGLVATSVNSSVWFGSNAYTQPPVPALVCNPLSGLHKVKTQDGMQGMRFNPACFATPAYGKQGPEVLPYMRLPNYWDSDLGIYKSFHITESQSVRVQAPPRRTGSTIRWDNSRLANNRRLVSLELPADYAGNLHGLFGGQCSLRSQPTNQNTATTGAPAFKTGSRFVTLASEVLLLIESLLD